MPRLGAQGCVQVLEQKLEALAREHRSVKKEIHGATKKLSCTRKRSRQTEAAAVRILQHTEGNKILMRRYLEQQSMSAEDGQCLDAVEAAAWKIFSEQASGNPAKMEPTAHALPAAQERKIARFMKEHSLVTWVEKRNLEQGIAPLSALVAEEAINIGCLPATHSSTNPRTRRQWLRRWRMRWDITLGRIAAREHLAPEESSTRVRCVEFLIAGTFFGTGFWAEYDTQPVRKVGPHCGPVFGPSSFNLEAREDHFLAPIS
jgi:hypothetical protein